LTSLPTLPNSLIYLDCYFNSLSTLPLLPNSLRYIDCSWNYGSSTNLATPPPGAFDSLPSLPNSPKHLNCSMNHYLKNLPALPPMLTYLNCTADLCPPCAGPPPPTGVLNSLPTLPNSLDTLICNDNNISCFPVFPNSLIYVAIDNPYTCLPNYVLPSMNSYTTTPLCEAGNTNGCPVAATCTASTGVSFTLIQDTALHTWDTYPVYPSNIKTANWHWGDGHITNGLYPSHTYTSPNLRNICVYITDSNNCGTSFCQIDSVYRVAYNSKLSSMVYINVLNSSQANVINEFKTINNDINIYPNPASNILSIAIGNKHVALVKIFDVFGNEIINTMEKEIDISNLSNGVYLIQVKINQSVVSKKIIVQR
jgi:hypothetical protein